MRILIIGCGYLGLRAAQRLLSAGHDVTALTRSEERARQWASQGIHPVVGDILQPDTLKQLPEADVCLYSVGYDRTAAASKREVYVTGLLNVLQSRTGRISKLLYISSTSVYGQNNGEVVDESSLCEPESEAGEICLTAEQLVIQFQQSGAIPSATTLRLSGLYGPQRLIARIDQLKNGVPLTGNPEAWLNLIHVDDAVEAVLRLVERPTIAPLYLLSDDAPLQRKSFYTAITQLVGAPTPTFSPGDDSGLGKRCDNTFTRQSLNLTLRYPKAIDALKEVLDQSELRSQN
ncbi:SDR family oxidoreductase [Planctomicrobium sp. SH527]|uniref:SDR family oxidoreductase n=1 Tax=Planctomicrobium sp. SH527 TaxID=3448123 RepID=UPI003F5B0E8F